MVWREKSKSTPNRKLTAVCVVKEWLEVKMEPVKSAENSGEMVAKMVAEMAAEMVQRQRQRWHSNGCSHS